MIKINIEKELDDFNLVNNALVDYFKLKGDICVNVDFLDKEQIRIVNNQFRQVDKATDVLSFPMLELVFDSNIGFKEFNKDNFLYDYDDSIQCVILGDILICEDIAKEQAVEYNHSYKRELAYLYLHAMLHLLGYDHIKEEDKKKMRLVEEDILNSIGILRENNI